MAEMSLADAILKHVPGILKPLGGAALWFFGLFSEKARLQRKPVRYVPTRVLCFPAKMKNGEDATQVDITGYVTNLSDTDLLLLNVYVRERGFDQVKALGFREIHLPAQSGGEFAMIVFLPRATKPAILDVIIEDNLDRRHVKTVKVDRHW